MDWSKLPDLIAVGLLAGAFASVARRGHERVSAHWLTGWLLILMHFATQMFAGQNGRLADALLTLSYLALVWAGLLFMRSAVPYGEKASSRIMQIVLTGGYTLYGSALMLGGPQWVKTASAVFLGFGPLLLALAYVTRFRHVLLWLTVGLQVALGTALLAVRNRPDADEIAVNILLLTIYLSCSMHFWHTYRRATAGAFITITGFFLWASVFFLAPLQTAYLPAVHIEGEVWNLPKYIVAVGMILLVLEDQIAYNKHLALHDELTGLPNRRLFQDRLTNAVERARRTGKQAALLIVDLNNFKQINDTFGHHAGDLVLQSVGKLFGGRVRRSDTVARTGGDEFAIILECPTSRTEASLVSEALLGLLKSPMHFKQGEVEVSASIGIAVYPDDAENVESLCITADLRMYDDKRAGRDGGEDEPPRTSHAGVALLI